MTNRLADATSPYLLQHAENPVDWHEWGDDAFTEAVRRDVPVLLSIGYAACHWCHVMAHESFEDPATAEEMNAQFVCIKVDREERPDIDAVYMTALQMMTGQGGWPMTVFLTPDTREPFYAGTYFPASARFGSPSFRQVLQACREAWDDRRDDLVRSASRVTEHLAAATPDAGDASPGRKVLAASVEGLARDFDAAEGGFGGAPKFPPAMTIVQLLRHAARDPDADESAQACSLVSQTCRGMARGGIYDQLAGGFCRYSTDATWTVPHFEKMLYDNALLLRAYTDWWVATSDPLAERIATETAQWMLSDLGTEEGAFAASLDADSGGVEGAFYVWSPAELEEVLGRDDAEWAAEVFHVVEPGTFDHDHSVLKLQTDPDDDERLARVRRALLAARSQRTRPGRDDKIVAAWNGQAISALARAGKVFDRPEFVDAAVSAAEFVRNVHVSHGRLIRTSRRGRSGTAAGVADDYGCVAEAFLDLYQVTGNASWCDEAQELLDSALTHFTDSAEQPTEFFDTADDAEQLIVRTSDPTDNASPSGRAAIGSALLAFSTLTGSHKHGRAAERALAVYAQLAVGYPRFAGWGLAAAEALADGPRQVVIVEAADTDHALATAAWRTPAAGCVIAVQPENAESAGPLFEGRTAIRGRDTAYVCRGFVCDLPVTEAGELRQRFD